MLFLCPQWSSGPYISRNLIIWTHFVNASWKNRTNACTFPVPRKEIIVVKVRFTMRYSSRKLRINDKVITTASNFWRQIACSFQVMSGNILFLGKKIFEIPPFFQTRPGDLGKKVHACSLRFSALKIKVSIRQSEALLTMPAQVHFLILPPLIALNHKLYFFSTYLLILLFKLWKSC